jgi:hypothetical protein
MNILNRFLLVTCFALFGLALFSPLPAVAAESFAPLPAAHGASQSPLLMRVVQYQGSSNGFITVEVKNPTDQPQEFQAKGIYFVPRGNADQAPQRLGAVGPFVVGGAPGGQRRDQLTIAAGATVRLTLDVYCMDSHRSSPSSATGFRVAKDRVPAPLVRAIDSDAARASEGLGGVSAPAARSAVQSQVWKNRDKKWIPLDGEGKQEAGKRR